MYVSSQHILSILGTGVFRFLLTLLTLIESYLNLSYPYPTPSTSLDISLTVPPPPGTSYLEKLIGDRNQRRKRSELGGQISHLYILYSIFFIGSQITLQVRSQLFHQHHSKYASLRKWNIKTRLGWTQDTFHHCNQMLWRVVGWACGTYNPVKCQGSTGT